MADQDVRLERHGELWKEQNKQLARWTFGLALFASVALIRVLVPYADLADRLKKQQDDLTSLRSDLEAIKAEKVTLDRIDQQLEDVRKQIASEPWMAEKVELVSRLRDLNAAYERLRDAPRERVLQAVREADQASSPAAQRAVMQAQMSGGGALQMPNDSQRIVPGRLTQIENAARGPAEDAALLGLERDRLVDVTSDEPAWRRYLDERLQRQIQQTADDKVRRIVERVNKAVIEPLELSLPAGGDPAAQGTLRPQIASLRAEMDRWAHEHIGNRGWYETIQQKDRELGQLTASLRSRQVTFGTLLRGEQQALERKKSDRDRREGQAKTDVAAIESAQGRLGTEMERLLPDWTRGLLSIEEMLQLYPLALLGLVTVVAVKAALVRHHYLVVREGYQAQDKNDAAMSSLWTLVERGPLGTALTALVYLGGSALVWWLFERGCGLAQVWFLAHPSASWGWVAAWLLPIRWAGRLTFTTVLVGVPVILLKDRAARRRNDRVQRAERAGETPGHRRHLLDMP